MTASTPNWKLTPIAGMPPRAERTLEGVLGHVMAVERPREINERIVGFLQRVAPAAGTRAAVR